MSENTGQTRGSAIAVVKAAQMSVGSALVGAGATAGGGEQLSFDFDALKEENAKQTSGIMAMLDTLREQIAFDKEAFRRNRDQAREKEKEKQLAASNSDMDMSGGIADASKEMMSLGPLLLIGLTAIAGFARALNVDEILRLPQQIKSIKAMATFAKGVGTIATLGFGPKILDNLKAAAKSFRLKPDAFSPKNIGFLDRIKDFFKPLTTFFANARTFLNTQIDSIKTIFTGEGKFAQSLRNIGRFFDDAFKSIQVTLKPITDTLKSVFGMGKEGGALAKLFAPLRAVGRAIGKLFLPITIIMGIFDGVEGFLKEYRETGSIVDGIRGAVVGIVDGFIGTFVRLLTDLVAMALEFLGLENLGQFVRNFGEDVTKFFNKAVGGIVDFVMGIFTFDGERILGGLSGMFSGVAGFFGTVLTAPINMAVNFIKDLFGFGDPGVPFDLMAEVTSAATAAFEWFKGLFSIDFGAIKSKIFDIGLMLKAMTAGGIAAVKAIAPGGESPAEAYTRVYSETLKSGQMKREADERDAAMGLDVSKKLNPYEAKMQRINQKKDRMALAESGGGQPINIINNQPTNVNNTQSTSANTVATGTLNTASDNYIGSQAFSDAVS